MQQTPKLMKVASEAGESDSDAEADQADRWARGRNALRARRRRGLLQARRDQQRQIKQNKAYNKSGRGRTVDHLFPDGNGERAKARGKGAWKRWTNAAILRAGFSDENAGCRQIAQEVDGASHTNAGASRYVVAGAATDGEMAGIEKLKERRLKSVVLAIMFDESSFDCKLKRGAMESHSILCSHAQISFAVDGEREDEHVTRPPRSLCPMNSGTMWEALKAGPGATTQINELDGERKGIAEHLLLLPSGGGAFAE